MGSIIRWTRLAAAAGSLLGTLASGPAWALTLQLGGYSSSPLATLASSGSGITVAADGTIYVSYGADPQGIRQISPAGVESPWSSAQVVDLIANPSGGAIGAGVEACKCLVRVETNGSYSTFAQDSVIWRGVALGQDGTLFAMGNLNVSNGTQAVYQIDAVSGERTLLESDAFCCQYVSLAVGSDGELYAIQYDTYPQLVVARFDGSQFTTVVALPHGGGDLVRGTEGLLWCRTSFDYGSGYPIGEIWVINSGNADATLFAQTSWVDASFWGLGYDPDRKRLYIGDPSHHLLQPSPVLQSVTGGLLPARSATWGKIKALYRGER